MRKVEEWKLTLGRLGKFQEGWRHGDRPYIAGQDPSQDPRQDPRHPIECGSIVVRSQDPPQPPGGSAPWTPGAIPGGHVTL